MKNRKRLGLAAVITGLFMGIEVIGGLISGSLALLADAGHMLTDFVALYMAWAAIWLSIQPPSWRYTFGWGRLPILVAFVNGLTLIGISIWICFEALRRFITPAEILAGPMLTVAIIGLLVNVTVLIVLTGADRENLNIRGAVLHVMGDMLGSVAAIVAACVILYTGWMAIDPLLSVLVAILIFRSAMFLIKDSGHILLEGAPAGLDRREITQDLVAHVPGLVDISELRIWAVTPEDPEMIIKGRINPDADPQVIRDAVTARLISTFQIDYATIDLSRT